LCWDCHDPHGDRSFYDPGSGNELLWFMVQRNPVRRTTSSLGNDIYPILLVGPNNDGTDPNVSKHHTPPQCVST
jgi:hypothetical protein